MAAAATFLAVRQRSVEETRRRLNRLGYPSALTDEVVGRLVDLGYLDDLAFAKAWLESRDRARPRGEVALRRELQRSGVPDETIQQALAERTASMARHDPRQPGDGHPDDRRSAGDAEVQAAQRLIERRSATLRREPDPQRRRQRAYALLARNGFTPDVCREVSRQLGADLDHEPIDDV